MKFRSMLAGILSRRNTASLAFIDPKLRALPLSPPHKWISFPLSQKIKNRRIPFVVSSCNRANLFPTAALSTSGIRVEGDSFLSACQNKLPCIFCCQNKTGATFCGRSCKKSLHDDFLRRHYPHQVIGSKFGYFLSACQHKLPCIYFGFIINSFFAKCKVLPKFF